MSDFDKEKLSSHSDALNDEFSDLAEDIAEYQLEQATIASMKSKVMQRLAAPCPEGGETTRASEADWIEITDKLAVKILSIDMEKKVQCSLWRLKAGGVVPSHYHNSDEDCLVLEGDIRFGDHVLYAGDFHRMEKGSTHPAMTTTSGAIVYLKHDVHEDLSWLSV